MFESPYIHDRTILSYDDVLPFAAGISDEYLVDVTTYDTSIIAEYMKPDMIPLVGNTIYVRDALARKLAAVNRAVNAQGYSIKLVYGYRHPEIQNKYFTKRRLELARENPAMNDADLDRLTHNFVAKPDIAGHPAAAAVDLTLVGSDGFLVDMGTAIADYTDPNKIQTFDGSASTAQHANRMILHNAMLAQRFAPFYGEWWHFSYGDREWAAFYNKQALFGPIDFTNS